MKLNFIAEQNKTGHNYSNETSMSVINQTDLFFAES